MFNKRRTAALKVIRKKLTTEFCDLSLKSIDMLPDLSDIILYSKSYTIKAKFVDKKSKLIHIKLENVEGFVYEWSTENYEWFLKTFFV